MAGGASFAPNLRSLLALEIAAINSSSWSNTAETVFMKNVKNCKLLIGVLPGLRRLTPVFVAKGQLLCFPDPLIPLNGFSWNKTSKSCLFATLCIISINKELWSTDKLTSSKIGANSNWLGATSLCLVLTGIPSLKHSNSSSFMNSKTRFGIDPK